MRGTLRWARCGLLLAVLALGAGCDDTSEPQGPSVGTNSNWLRACTEADSCGEARECRCGACTLSCASDADCGELEDARCAVGEDLAALAECGVDAPMGGICLPRCQPGSCDPGQACVAQACVLAEVPDVSACDGAAEREPALRALEDELLERLQALRGSGGAVCGGAEPAPPAPPLRFDGRLLCAARVYAADIDQHGPMGAGDSQGRTTADRQADAGYASSWWADGFALDAADAQTALELMLADADTCARFVDPVYTDVAAGASGSVLVLTLGAP